MTSTFLPMALNHHSSSQNAVNQLVNAESTSSLGPTWHFTLRDYKLFQSSPVLNVECIILKQQ